MALLDCLNCETLSQQHFPLSPLLRRWRKCEQVNHYASASKMQKLMLYLKTGQSGKNYPTNEVTGWTHYTFY